MTVNYPCKTGKDGNVLTKRWRGLLLHFTLAAFLAFQITRIEWDVYCINLRNLLAALALHGQ